MGILLISFTDQGAETARRLAEGLSGTWVRSSELSVSVSEFTRKAFLEKNALVFVGAVGIAVRMIAPYIKDKATDPAVVAVDELGRFAIPLLSGHLGGANELAYAAAKILGAVPVVTTATDLHHAFAVDLFAKENHLAIENMTEAKRVSAAVLAGEAIGFFSDFPVEGPVPKELTPGRWQKRNIYITQAAEQWPQEITEKLQKPRAAKEGVFLLRLFPKTAVLGMGCRKGVSREAVLAAAKEAVRKAGISPFSLRCLASIDLKREEPALCFLAEKWKLPFFCFPAKELEQIEGDFSESAFVQEITGVGNVCERAAVAGCGQPSVLLAGKTAVDGVTAAVASAEVIPVYSFTGK